MRLLSCIQKIAIGLGFILNVFPVLDRLEDPEAEEVKDFVQKQVKLTESVLEKCETREKLALFLFSLIILLLLV